MEPDECKINLDVLNARYRRLFEASRDGILILESDTGRIVDVNPYFLKLTGYKSEEILNAFIWETGPFKDTSLSKNSFEALLTEKYIRYEDFSLTARNGRKINVEFVINVYSADGQKLIQCNIRDVTTRKQAVKKILEQRATLNAILESAEFPIFSIDRDYRYTAFNRAHADVMKSIYRVHIHLGDSLVENKTVPEDWLTSRKNLDRALQGETVLELVSSGENGLECRYFEVAHHPVHTEAGGIIGVSVFAREVTPQKRIEDELRFRNLILSTQQESLIDGILVVDTRGKILSSNQRFVHMWDIPADIIESKSDELVLQALKDKLVNPEEYIAKVKHLYETPGEKSQDEIALKDGRTFDRYSAPMLGADGKYFGRVWYFRDITVRKQAEDDLRFTNLVLSTQQEAFIDGILVMDTNGKILSTNRRFANLWGIPLEVIESKSDERVLQAFMDKSENPEEYVGKVRHLRENPGEISQDDISLKDGRTFDRYSAPMQGPNGKHVGRVWYFRDITVRKQAEDDLRFTNLVLSTQQEAFIDGILVLDTQGKILSVNRRFSSLLGIPSEIMESKSDERILQALKDKLVDPEEHGDKVKHLYEKPEEISQDDIILKDGRTFDRYSAPMIGVDGKNIGRVWYFRDISVRKRAEDDLKFRDRILATQLEVSIDGILVVDTKGGILSSNKRFADLWSIPSDVVESKSDELVLRSLMEKLENPEEYINKVRHLYKTPDEISRDEIALKDGRTFDRYSASMLDADGKHFGRVWYFRDITERKQAEDKLRFTNLVLSTQQEAFIDGILVLDTQGKILSVNRRFSNLWGISSEIMASKSDKRVLQALTDKLENPEEYLEKLRHLQGNTTEVSQDDVPLKDGRTFDRYSAPMLGADGKHVGRVWYFRDITQRKQAEDKLRFTNLVLSTQQEAFIDGILVLNAQGKILSVNRRFSSLLGISSEIMESKSDERILQALKDKLVDPEEHGDKVKHLYEKPEEISQDDIILKDGRTFDRYSAPMIGVDGKNIGRVWYFRDISVRKRAEDDLKFRDRILATQLEVSIDGILVVDTKGRILSSNKRFADLWSIPNDVIESKSEDSILQALKEKLETPAEYIAKVKHLYETPDEISRDEIALKDGRTFDRYSASMLGADGKHFGRVWYFRDVTERKQAENELRFRDRILATQLEVSIDGILVVDTKGKILSSNKRFANLWGIPINIIETKSDERTLQSLIAEKLENPEEYMRIVKHIYEKPDETSQDEIFLKDGRTFDRYLAPMLGADGKHFGRVWYFRDVTERKRAEVEKEKLEEQLRGSQKMEAVGRLAGGVAHDFNNLLSVILSYTSFAMKGIHEGDPVKDDLLEVKKAAERAAELTRQLLAFGRKQVLQPVPLNLNHVALGIEKMLRRIIGEDIEFVQQLAPNLGVVRADRGQIEQVLMNLVINARDAMTEGGKLTIETSNVDLDAEYASRHEDVIPGPYVQLAVSDTGSGMDEKTKEKIFEPFFTTKEKGKGTGLGLATVHGIVKQSGGHIWFYSEKDHGTTFKIYLPREMAATVSTVQPAMIPRRVTGNETILVVEDEEALRKVAKRSLDAVGYKVLIAVDGDDALKIYANYKGEIKLLLTDVVMPKMSGFELAQELMKKQPNLKVLYMSGYTDNVYFHHGMLDGGVNFLGKPFTEDSLTLKVREVLDGVVAESDGKEKAFEDAALEKARLVNVEDLRSLNASTLDQLRGAVMAARYDRIVETVEGIRVAKPVLAAEIRRLADLFDYEGLKNLLGIGKA
jgi:PAS domain S-box-containing protein